MRKFGAEKLPWLVVEVQVDAERPDASRSGKSGLVSSSTRRYLKLVIGSVHLCEGHERAGEWELDHGTVRYAERAMAKVAYNSISRGLSTENPRAPPMADFATIAPKPPVPEGRLARAFRSELALLHLPGKLAKTKKVPK